MIQLIVNMTDRGVTVIRADGKIPDFQISVLEQSENPKLGQICATRNMDEVFKAINDCVAEATGGTL